MRRAWAAGDGTAYGAVFREDARYVTAPGERSVGRDAIANSHQKIFDTIFRGTRLGGEYPSELQAISPDVVLVHATGAVLFAGERERDVPPNGLITCVVARGPKGWEIASFSNTPTGKGRAARFIWRFLKGRLRMLRAGK